MKKALNWLYISIAVFMGCTFMAFPFGCTEAQAQTNVTELVTKYFATLFRKLPFSQIDESTFQDQSLLFLTSLGFEGTQKFTGNKQTGQRAEVEFEWSSKGTLKSVEKNEQTSELKQAQTPIDQIGLLLKFLASQQFEGDKDSQSKKYGAFIRQDLYIGGDYDYFILLAKQLENEVGRKPDSSRIFSAQTLQGQNKKNTSTNSKTVFYRWNGTTGYHLWISFPRNPDTEIKNDDPKSSDFWRQAIQISLEENLAD